jgi:flagellar basal body-associated protein FliL
MNEREIDEIDNEEYMLNEMYSGPSQTTEMYTVENNNSKGKNGLIIFLIFTTLLFGGLFTYYFFVSTKCKETTKEEINFDKLTSSPAFEQWLNAKPKKGHYGNNFKRIEHNLNFQNNLADFLGSTINRRRSSIEYVPSGDPYANPE